MSAGSLIDAAAVILQDSANIHWTRSELLGYLNAAQAFVVALAPESYTLVQDVTASTDSQVLFQLPTDGVALVEIYHNTVGKQTAVQRIERPSLETTYPGWRASAPAWEAKHYAFDPQNPKNFWLYPPLKAGAGVRLACSVAPPVLTSESDDYVVNPVYKIALIHYMLYAAFTKDAEVAANAERASNALTVAKAFIADKRGVESTFMARDL